jgi:hypothetical protein
MPPRWVLFIVLAWVLLSVVLTLVVTHFRHQGMTP